MKKWSGGAIIIFLIFILLLQYTIFNSPLSNTSLQTILYQNNTDPILWLDLPTDSPSISPRTSSTVITIQSIFSSLLSPRNLSKEEQQILHSWNHLNHLTENTNQLPHGFDAIKEANDAWFNLMLSLEDEKSNSLTANSTNSTQKQCPYSIRQMDASGLPAGEPFVLKIPCGMVQGSSVTIIGTPDGLLGEFRIDLLGGTGPGEPRAPILLHCNVRLGGDKLSDDPVIVQNTWTVNEEWGNEERCPPDSNFDETAKVDGFAVCNEMVGKEEGNRSDVANKIFNISRNKISRSSKYFPFKQNHLAIAILRVGAEGIHMTVDGKHITSFAFRESLEPWLASEVRITGEMKLLSVIASGLPTSEKVDHAGDLQLLRAPSVPLHKSIDLFIGVFSNANNFKRRMAIRRTWMQFDHVRSGSVVVRFFVGLHKNQIVNEELWREARTYGDIQLMPFVDYYSLIAWKTIAICIFGTNIVSAKYVMKTDDDAFVRVDAILSNLNRINITNGLLFGKVNFDSQPHRDPDSKWHITNEEWPEEKYPPWAHGPGYIISRNIAKMVYKQHKKGRLKMFKLEDVAMGIWIDEMKKSGTNVEYINEDRIYPSGCERDYLLAHYQEPRDLLCLWEKLQRTKRADCCGDR